MSKMRALDVAGVQIGNDLPLTLIAGPCQLESFEHALAIAEVLAEACAREGLGFVFKSSFDKANRTSAGAPRGPGIDAGLEMLGAVKARLGVPVLTDVHLPEQAATVAEVADILQIPAFLCRQTDLLVAAGETGKVVNIKKGQFLAPWEMPRAAAKVAATGNENVMLTERGSSFGYNALVADMRSLPIMADTGYPVIMDATHAVQMPGGQGAVSDGDRRMAPGLARAGVSLGIAGVFIETDPDPESAPSDGPNMIRLEDMAALIADLAAFDKLAKANPFRLD